MIFFFQFSTLCIPSNSTFHSVPTQSPHHSISDYLARNIPQWETFIRWDFIICYHAVLLLRVLFSKKEITQHNTLEVVKIKGITYVLRRCFIKKEVAVRWVDKVNGNKTLRQTKTITTKHFSIVSVARALQKLFNFSYHIS